jgi:hypothetical protein
MKYFILNFATIAQFLLIDFLHFSQGMEFEKIRLIGETKKEGNYSQIFKI